MDLNGKCFLVVDSDEHMLKMFTKFFNREGAEVTTSATIDEALSILTEKKHTAVIIDINLKGDNGFGLLNKLKRLDSDLTVLLLTGRPSLLIDRRIKESGVKGYLEKPVDLRSLKQKLVKILESDRNQVISE